jgi:adenylosuccinate synthase
VGNVTVVVGGQFGSEGKGKVAQFLAAEQSAQAAVRVGGSNSGHTGITPSGERLVLRHLPTPALLPDVACVIGPGSYVDPEVLLFEIELVGLSKDRVMIDENAFLITSADCDAEREGGLRDSIGSTLSGTGASVSRRIARRDVTTVRSDPRLRPYVRDVSPFLRSVIDRSERIIVEGTQGFGLSVIHSPHYPFVTSRDTSAAGAIAEAGLSPLDVDQVALVLRSFPIRVAGRSGPLPNEITWETLARESGYPDTLAEFTSVTGRLRRIARFDAEIVRQAIAVNCPTLVVMNHIDYVDARCLERGTLTERARTFVAETATAIGRNIDLVGLGPSKIVETRPQLASVAS